MYLLIWIWIISSILSFFLHSCTICFAFYVFIHSFIHSSIGTLHYVSHDNALALVYSLSLSLFLFLPPPSLSLPPSFLHPPSLSLSLLLSLFWYWIFSFVFHVSLLFWFSLFLVLVWLVCVWLVYLIMCWAGCLLHFYCLFYFFSLGCHYFSELLLLSKVLNAVCTHVWACVCVYSLTLCVCLSVCLCLCLSLALCLSPTPPLSLSLSLSLPPSHPLCSVSLLGFLFVLFCLVFVLFFSSCFSFGFLILNAHVLSVCNIVLAVCILSRLVPLGRELNAKKYLYAYSLPSEIKNLSCLVLSCLALPYLALSCLVVSCLCLSVCLFRSLSLSLCLCASTDVFAHTNLYMCKLCTYSYVRVYKQICRFACVLQH